MSKEDKINVKEIITCFGMLIIGWILLSYSRVLREPFYELDYLALLSMVLGIISIIIGLMYLMVLITKKVRRFIKKKMSEDKISVKEIITFFGMLIIGWLTLLQSRVIFGINKFFDGLENLALLLMVLGIIFIIIGLMYLMVLITKKVKKKRIKQMSDEIAELGI